MMRGLIGFLLVVVSIAAMAQNEAWRDSARIMMHQTRSQKAYYNLAESYANAGIPDSSIAILNRGLLMTRDIAWERSIRMALGWLYAGKGLHSVAERELLSALRISLEVSDSTTAARCCIIIGDIADLDGLSDKAVEYKQRALNYRPDTYGKFSYAISLMHAGKWVEAGSIFKQCRHSDLSGIYEPQAWYFLAECELHLNRVDSAASFAAHFRQAIDRDPVLATELRYYLWLKGRCEMAGNNSFEARSDFKKALALKLPGVHYIDDWNAELPEIYKNLIILYQAAGMKDSATYFLRAQLENTTSNLVQLKQDAGRFQLSDVDAQLQQYELKNENDRRTRSQYLLITLTIVVLAGMYFVASGSRFSGKFGSYYSSFVLIITFEFILVVADPILSKWAGDQAIYKFLLNVVIALVLIPIDRLIQQLLTKFVIVMRKK